MKNKMMTLGCIILFIVGNYSIGGNSLKAENLKYKVIFEDNFEQTDRIPNSTKWSLCPNKTAAWAKYLSSSYDQAYVENGKLILKAEKVSGIYKTGGIQTKGKFDFTYGKVEVNARFITAKGAWPAIWMMPTDRTGEWPTCGEIDIMEQLNHDNYVYQTIHNHYKNDLGFTTPTPTKTISYNVNQFNTYAIEWSSEKIVFSVNGIVSFTYPNLHLTDEVIKKQWPYNKSFYLILNCALGGAGTWPGVITDSELPASMEVDWVKVSQEEITGIVQETTTTPTLVSIKDGKLRILNSVTNSQLKIFNASGQLVQSNTISNTNCSLSIKPSTEVFIVQIEQPCGTKKTFKISNN
jgi:beta-glucanase (GH16 family)